MKTIMLFFPSKSEGINSTIDGFPQAQPPSRKSIKFIFFPLCDHFICRVTPSYRSLLFTRAVADIDCKQPEVQLQI